MTLKRQQIETFVHQQGLIFLGVATLDVGDDFVRFKQWLDEQKHASMNYLENYLDVRANPLRLFPEARSCIVYGLSYNDSTQHANRGGPQVAKYAQVQDYHKVLRRQGELILKSLQQITNSNLQGRVLVDTAPLLERAIAARTQSMFIGKNTLAISPASGSFLLLGELFLDQDVGVDVPLPTNPKVRDPETGGCGTCRRCQVHCPTNALDEDYRLDANRCLSYWTIEHRGMIPTEFWPHMSKYWYGCDICQDVCPYNRGHSASGLIDHLRKWEPIDLFDVATMNQQNYELWFGGFPMTRAKREGLMRNALIALYVTDDPRLPEALKRLEAHEFEVIRTTVKQIVDM